MESIQQLTALADETRLNIIILLINSTYCVRALSRELGISEPAVSQHLKILREAGLITGEKKGYFMHYQVNKNALYNLADEISSLAGIKSKSCLSNPEIQQSAVSVKHQIQQNDPLEEIHKFNDREQLCCYQRYRKGDNKK